MDFFNNLGNKITKTGQKAVDKTKQLTSIAKLNYSISDAKGDLDKLYRNLGMEYFDNIKDDIDSEFAVAVTEIKAKLAEIEELNEQLSQAKGFVKCPSCGAEISVENKFCGRCGHKMQNAEPAEEEPADAEETDEEE